MKENLYKGYSLHIKTMDKIKSVEEKHVRFEKICSEETCDTRGVKHTRKV
jgi:hypothetical protein